MLALIKAPRVISREEFEAYEESRRKGALQSLANNVSARPELLIFGAKDWLLKNYAAITERVAIKKQQGLFNYLRQPGEMGTVFIENQVVQLLQSGTRALLYVAVAFQPDFFNNMSISEVTFVETSIGELLANILLLQQSLSVGIFRDLFQVRNLFECMEAKSNITSAGEEPAEYRSHPNGMKIEVRDLAFSYYEGGVPVLEDVNFVIEPGQIVSIVGYNGSGGLNLKAD